MGWYSQQSACRRQLLCRHFSDTKLTSKDCLLHCDNCVRMMAEEKRRVLGNNGSPSNTIMSDTALKGLVIRSPSLIHQLTHTIRRECDISILGREIMRIVLNYRPPATPGIKSTELCNVITISLIPVFINIHSYNIAFLSPALCHVFISAYSKCV